MSMHSEALILVHTTQVFCCFLLTPFQKNFFFFLFSSSCLCHPRAGIPMFNTACVTYMCTVYAVLVIKSKASYMLGKYPTY